MWSQDYFSLAKHRNCSCFSFLGMDQFILLVLVISSATGKYVYVKDVMSWPSAQRHCQTFYTDLAPVNNLYDINYLRKVSGNFASLIWIGLHRNLTNEVTWFWSGGSKVFRFFWQKGEPNGIDEGEAYGAIRNYTWYDIPITYMLSFFCYKVHAIRERKTWEEALQYCRKHKRDLASVASKTEMMLMENELKKGYSTENVWIGLHFFDGDWLWVDRQYRGYESWSQGVKPWCPNVNMSCAALQMMGTTKVIVTNRGTKEEVMVVQDVQGWNSQNCNERLYFLCY